MAMSEDERICKKYDVKFNSPNFAMAKYLESARRDYTLCGLPMLLCPHCAHEWQWGGDSWLWLVGVGDTMDCPKCERTIHIIAIETTTSVRLSTHKDEG